MKKVRFQSPNASLLGKMEETDCHSPRPYNEDVNIKKSSYNITKPVPFFTDSVQRYERSNSSPFPVICKTDVLKTNEANKLWTPSKDLDLSMLESSYHEPRHPLPRFQQAEQGLSSSLRVLSSLDNTAANPANILTKDNDFFLKRDNIGKFLGEDINSLNSRLKTFNFNKENNPMYKKAEFMGLPSHNNALFKAESGHIPQNNDISQDCRCHHCINVHQTISCKLNRSIQANDTPHHIARENCNRFCHCMIQPPPCLCIKTSHEYQHEQNQITSRNTSKCLDTIESKPHNAVDKKNWTIEKYEQSKNEGCTDIEKQKNVKEKREPTVSDLFKIIKLQNEQLQLLQEKVDKFIMSSAQPQIGQNKPIQNVQVAEQKTLESADADHKISIGVMTSFEMVRTSTIINKEIVKQINENAQIQCNKSQISIKEVVTKSQPVNLNFLDGIKPVDKNSVVTMNKDEECNTQHQQLVLLNEDKTLNELSLCNVQVDNATTPLISPDQSLYLDVRDYSDSDSGDNNHSNVGWTYYNKVMTHVNGILHDSDMPSSASALYRHTRQQCIQMQIDKTNVSVTKRVKFGDDPLVINQPHILKASSDTSLKMNQLAAKYLKNTPVPVAPCYVAPKQTMPGDMSFATRNYMEQHKILQAHTLHVEMPRFLDITALKQQPKFL